MERQWQLIQLYAPFYVLTMKITVLYLFLIYGSQKYYSTIKVKSIYRLKLKLRNVHISIRPELLDKEIEFVVAHA